MRNSSQRAFTSLELVVVVGTLLLLILLAPLIFRPRVRCCPIQCISNVKQISLAFRMWSNDHEEKFPMQLPEAQGGSETSALAGNAVPSFIAISNELNSPKVLACPQDAQRFRTNDFTFLGRQNLSYFLGIHADETNASSILVGDRNLVVNGVATNGLVNITLPQSITWGSGMHKGHGNLALADGSTSQATIDGLQRALRGSGFETNRFAVP